MVLAYAQTYSMFSDGSFKIKSISQGSLVFFS